MSGSIDNATLGFILVISAGMATSIGAAVVFSKRMISFANHAVLGAALGLTTGVMLYVSFIEIFFKSLTAFEDAGYDSRNSYLYATLCFFGGIAGIKLINILVHWLDGSHMACGDLDEDMVRAIQNFSDLDDNINHLETTNTNVVGNDSSEIKTTEELLEESNTIAQMNVIEDENDVERSKNKCELFEKAEENSDFEERIEQKKLQLDEKLHRMGMMTALAIAIHNFPEGLATFVATIHDPSVGASLAIAIAIHNIPEGLCVSIPIYFATKDRKKAFLWGFVSGISEIIGGGLGWVILKDVFDNLVYGIIFGLVAGMMVAICIHELLPTAHRYDPNDKYVSNFVILGMMIMAISLVAFKY